MLQESKAPPTAAHPDVTGALARFIVSTRYEDIPDKTRKDRRALVNSMAATLGGCRHGVIVRLTNSLLPFAGAGPAPLVGHDRELADAASYVSAIRADAVSLVEAGLMLEEDVARCAALAENWGRPRHQVSLPGPA